MSQLEKSPVSTEKALEMAHRALQSRLDGYRQTSASFIAALVAFSAAFDAFLIKIDPITINPLLASVICLIAILACGVVVAVLFDADQHFQELSGVVIKIERRVGLFCRVAGAESIFPSHWDAKLNNGSPGWRDFAVKACFSLSILIFFVQLVVIMAFVVSLFVR